MYLSGYPELRSQKEVVIFWILKIDDFYSLVFNFPFFIPDFDLGDITF